MSLFVAFVVFAAFVALLPAFPPPGSGASAARLDRRHRADGPAINQKVDSAGGGQFSAGAPPHRHYAGSMEGDAGNTVHDGTGHKGAPHRRVTPALGMPAHRPGHGAHRGGPHSARPSREPARWLRGAAPGGAGPAPGRRNHGPGLDHPAAGRAARRLLPRGHRPGEAARRPPDPVRSAALLGLVAGRRQPPVAAADLDQRRLRLAGLPAVLPAVARAPRRLALPAIALSTLFVIGALWFHNGVGTPSGRLLRSRPAWRRSCPWCSGPCSARPSLWSRGWPTGRCSWRRKTSGWRPKSCAGPVPNSPGPSTTPAPWPSAPGWPAKSTTPSPRACPASC